MSTYQSTLIGRTEVAEGTMAFQCEKPKDFVFKAGQYIDLSLSGFQPGQSNGLTHIFSIASSPYDEELLVTTRMRNTVFKQALSILPIGTEVRIEGPMGSFSVHQNTARPAVFLAAGLGSRHSSACSRMQLGRSFATRFFYFTRTAISRMPRS